MSMAEEDRDGRVASIIETVADAEGTPALELPPLYEYVDPECLETLLRSDGVTVSFEYLQYRVTATAEGSVYVIPRNEGEQRSADARRHGAAD